MHGSGFDREFLLSRSQLVAQCFVACLQSKNCRSLLSKLDLETIDRVAFLPQLRELACALGLELFDAHLKSPRRHGEFSAKLVLVGLNLGHRQWRRGFKPPYRQPDRTIVHEWNDNEPYEGRNEKPDPEIHDRFNHGTYVSNSRALIAARAGQSGCFRH